MVCVYMHLYMYMCLSVHVHVWTHMLLCDMHVLMLQMYMCVRCVSATSICVCV